MGKTKILMYQKHVAYIDNDLMADFDEYSPVVNFSGWVREQAKKDFGLNITNKYELEMLDNLVLRNHYTDKADWLREKMRFAIKNS